MVSTQLLANRGLYEATPLCQMPSFSWLKRCYQMIDRRYEMQEGSKNLKNSYTRKSLSLLFVCFVLWFNIPVNNKGHVKMVC